MTKVPKLALAKPTKVRGLKPKLKMQNSANEMNSIQIMKKKKSKPIAK